MIEKKNTNIDMRQIVQFSELYGRDIGKEVVFLPHETSRVYEQWLVGKKGKIVKVKNCLFDQQITVNFDYVLRFDEGKLNKILLSPGVVGRPDYREDWADEVAAEKYGKRTLILSDNDVLTVEQIRIYNNHYQRYNPRLKENLKYRVYRNGIDCFVEYDGSTSIGPTWRVSGNNLIFV
jgi:hypothetical protein